MIFGPSGRAWPCLPETPLFLTLDTPKLHQTNVKNPKLLLSKYYFWKYQNLGNEKCRTCWKRHVQGNPWDRPYKFLGNLEYGMNIFQQTWNRHLAISIKETIESSSLSKLLVRGPPYISSYQYFTSRLNLCLCKMPKTPRWMIFKVGDMFDP